MRKNSIEFFHIPIWLYMALDQLLRLSNSKQNWYLTGTYSTHEHHENRHATLGISMEIVFS